MKMKNYGHVNFVFIFLVQYEDPKKLYTDLFHLRKNYTIPLCFHEILRPRQIVQFRLKGSQVIVQFNFSHTHVKHAKILSHISIYGFKECWI